MGGRSGKYSQHVPYSTMKLMENRDLTQALIHLSDLQHQFRKTNKFLHIMLISWVKRAHALTIMEGCFDAVRLQSVL